ncbi:MAG: NADH:flavin oxidoreductase [Alphaproteobacteria bacterium]|nr:NADH:flavin oxidoreductase [Alphaproteobacteria bacterium]
MLQRGRYGILFEPVPIGPVTAKNRFYQVPQCCGMGHLRPQAHAAMRAVKAEGGWAVVSTEETEIHPSSDLSPYSEQRIWDEKDIPALRLMTDAVHEHDALAAIELVHNGYHSSNLFSRIPPLAPSDMAVAGGYPKQARAMDKSDIRDLRRWHRQAARRAKKAGFDVVYVYAGHGMTLTQQFLLPRFNTRSDEYGGSLENRARLLRELLEETKEEVGDSCAVALRFAVDELKGADGMQADEEGRAVVELLAELPDLWDVNVSDWANDSQTTRFAPEDGYQIRYVEFVKTITSKPVVAVSRLGSPDLMASLVKRGIVDFIGAARPSISDPFLPKKIEENRIDEIRECIGCNICVSSDNLGIPIRCTQNPTMGEEWRRGWHPERIERKATDASVLVVGAGPAGLECTMQLARRGYHVTLAEASDQLGGRVAAESGLKGLSAWLRVRDNRVYELQQKANVEIFTGSELSAEEILELGIENVFLATGSRWRADGVGRSSRETLAGLTHTQAFTADDIMARRDLPAGPVVIYDDDQGYLGGVITDHLSDAGHDTTIVTSAGVVSPWTSTTLEQERAQRTLLQQGVKILANLTIIEVSEDTVTTGCVFTGEKSTIPCRVLVLATERTPVNGLYRQLIEMKEAGRDEAFRLNVEIIGDALAPGLIADAVYSGHLAARNFQSDPAEIEQALYRREMPSLANQW